MSPAQAKQKQHERYEAVAVQVLRGRAGYKPAVKSRFSKSASSEFSHTIAFAWSWTLRHNKPSFADGFFMPVQILKLKFVKIFGVYVNEVFCIERVGARGFMP